MVKSMSEAPMSAPETSPMEAPSGAGSVLRRRLLLNLGFWSLCLIVAELLVGRAMPQLQLRVPPEEGRALRPFRPGLAGDQISQGRRVSYQINSLGYRDAERSIPRRKGQRRILCLGDSFTEGEGVPQDGTWPAVLERSSDKAEFWNLGWRGGNPQSYIVQARDGIAKLAPDALIVQLSDDDLVEIGADTKVFEYEADGALRGLRLEAMPRPAPLSDRFAILRMMSGRRGSFIKQGRHWPLPKTKIDLGRMLQMALGKEPEFRRRFGFFLLDERAQWGPRIARFSKLLTQLVTETRKASLGIAIVYIPHPIVWEAMAECRRITQPNPLQDVIRAFCRSSMVPYYDGFDLLRREASPKDLYDAQSLGLTPRGQKVLVRRMLDAGLGSFVSGLARPR